jgi:hypothetical protein
MKWTRNIWFVGLFAIVPAGSRAWAQTPAAPTPPAAVTPMCSCEVVEPKGFFSSWFHKGSRQVEIIDTTNKPLKAIAAASVAKPLKAVAAAPAIEAKQAPLSPYAPVTTLPKPAAPVTPPNEVRQTTLSVTAPVEPKTAAPAPVMVKTAVPAPPTKATAPVPPSDTAKILCVLTTSTSAELRETAAAVLGDVAPSNAGAAVKGLVTAARHDASAKVRLASVRALVRYQDRSPQVLSTLAALYKDTDPIVRAEAAVAHRILTAPEVKAPEKTVKSSPSWARSVMEQFFDPELKGR